MHARIDQLLNLREGEPVEAKIVAHVAACAECAQQLEQLKLTTSRLRELQPLDAPAAAWDQISHRVAQPMPQRQGWHVPAIITAASIAALAIATGWLLSTDRSKQNMATAPDVPQSIEHTGAAVTTEMSRLVNRSRQLEALLQVLPERPAVQRVSLAATIDTIERRIQWLDFQLSYAPDAQLSEQQAQRLWGERVELMDSLVKVRYAEAGHFSF